MTEYQRDDIYFCPDCCRFHSYETDEPVYVPGAPEFVKFDGNVYRVRNDPPAAKTKTTKSRRVR